jgi:hypothetical protein
VSNPPLMKAPPPPRIRKISAPVNRFVSIGKRQFTLSRGEHLEHYKNDVHWSDQWPILYQGKRAGILIRSLTYGTTAAGKPRWHASTRELYWTHSPDAPTGIGFDVSAFDTAREALIAWGRSADQILDWEEGKPIRSIYSKTGVYQKEAS